jgi:hypothetical protein
MARRSRQVSNAVKIFWNSKPEDEADLAAAASTSLRSGGVRSDAAYLLDAAREVLGPVQKVKRSEVVGTAILFRIPVSQEVLRSLKDDMFALEAERRNSRGEEVIAKGYSP